MDKGTRGEATVHVDAPPEAVWVGREFAFVVDDALVERSIMRIDGRLEVAVEGAPA